MDYLCHDVDFSNVTLLMHRNFKRSAVRSLRLALCPLLGSALLALTALLAGCGSSATAGTADQLRAIQIMTQPVSQTVIAGQPVTFSVQTVQSDAVRYQWYEDQTAIAEATGSSYTLTSPHVSQSGTSLTVEITDSVGSVTSEAATLTVLPIQPTLSFSPVPPITYGAGPVSLSASSASNAPVSYAFLSGPAMLSGSMLTPTGAGTVVVSANQAAMADYSATTVTTSFHVGQATPTLSFAAIANQTYGSTVAASASSASPGAITYSVSPTSIASLNGSAITMTGVGTVTVTATQAATANYAAATTTTSFSVAQATPTLSLAPIGSQIYGATLTVSGSSPSSGAITYTVSPASVASVAGSTITTTGVGTVTVTADQTATVDYVAAKATTSFTVGQATPALQLSLIANQIYGATLNASATSASPGAITYMVSPASLASVDGSTITTIGVGTVTVTANQAATADYASATATTSFVIAQAAPTLSFAPIPAVTYGAAPFNLNATSASNGLVTYSVLSGFASVVGSQLSLSGAGPVVLSATQAATSNYKAASTQTSFTVGSNVTLSAITPTNLTLAPGKQTFSTTAVGGVLDTVSWSASGGSFDGAAWTSPNVAGTYTITATSMDQPNRSVSTAVTISAPVITSEPTTANVCSAATLSLAVGAQYATSYQWLFNSAAIPGANAVSFSIPDAMPNANAGSYAVVVTNSAGSVTSNTVTVSIGSEITAQPQNASVTAPQTAQFSVTAQGQAPFSYQWFSVAPGTATPTSVAGATAVTYALPSVATSDGAKYFATVTDSCGSVLTSNQATLSVQSAPAIVVQPSLPAALAVNSTPTLNVRAAGDPALSYQWYWVPAGLQQAMPIAGAVSASYTLPSQASTIGNNGDSYYVVVSNALGQTTSSKVPVMVNSATSTDQWVVGWGASPENALAGSENPGGNAQSFRSLFYPTVSGAMERVHLSNLYNTAPITVGAARLAVSISGSAVDPGRDQPLTFNGQSSITLAPGQEAVSDPVQVNYTFGQKLAVSLYVSGSYASLTQHESQVIVNYATPSGTGDATTDVTGASFTQSNTEWFVLSGIDVYGAYQGAVALFGSSSIDGHGSNYGNTNAYPVFNNPIASQDDDRPSDWLARQLAAAGYNLGVLNAGTIGDPAAEDARTASGSSVAGVDRFNHDVLQQAGIKTAVIYIGGIDMRGDCVPATNVEASLTNIVTQAYTAGVRVILATLPPSEYCTLEQPLPSATYPYNGDEFTGPLNPSPENPGSTQRRLLNTWIRTTAPSLPGVVGIADFDEVLADPNHPDFMIPTYMSSDQFHPNGMGYGIQSSAIPLNVVIP